MCFTKFSVPHDLYGKMTFLYLLPDTNRRYDLWHLQILSAPGHNLSDNGAKDSALRVIGANNSWLCNDCLSITMDEISLTQQSPRTYIYMLVDSAITSSSNGLAPISRPTFTWKGTAIASIGKINQYSRLLKYQTKTKNNIWLFHASMHVLHVCIKTLTFNASVPVFINMVAAICSISHNLSRFVIKL